MSNTVPASMESVRFPTWSSFDRDGIVRDDYLGYSPHLETELREQLAKLTRQ
jgi:hypothetical protein